MPGVPLLSSVIFENIRSNMGSTIYNFLKPYIVLSGLILILCLILIASCDSNSESSSEKNISEFERLLGEEERRNLDEIINIFDSYLEEKFEIHPDSSLLKHYLQEITRTGSIDFPEIDTSRFYCNDLFNQYAIEFPDSIWIIDTIVYIKYPSLPVEERIVPPPPSKEVIDKWIERQYKSADIRIVQIGSYFSALDSVKNNDTLINSYLENRYAIGSLSPNLLAYALLRYLNDDSEYFAKRIYTMELLELEKIRILTDGNMDWWWREGRLWDK